MSNAGHKVTILSAYNGKQVIERWDGMVKVVLFPVVYENSFSFYRRLWAWIKFVYYCRIWLSNSKFDFAYLTSTPISVALLSGYFKKRRIPYFFEVRDLWPEIPIWLGHLNKLFGRAIIAYMHKIYHNAEAVVCLSDPVKDYLMKHYKLTKKPLLVTNFSDTSYYYRPELCETDKLQMVYIGALGDSAGVNELLALRSQLNQNLLPIHLHVAGIGKWERKFVATESEKNYTYHGFLKRDEVRQLLAKCHLGLVLFQNNEAFKFNSPNKFFDYLAAGLPVASNIKDAWYLTLAIDHQCGFYLNFNDPHSISHQLEYLLGSLQNKNLKANARQLAEQFKPETQLISALERLAKVYTLTPETSI
jgi:glycosyltransferase involved in cell wall biosynthesis